VEELKKLDYKGQPSELNQYSDIFKEHFEKNPASSVAEASDVIEKLTGVKRSPTQVREFLKRTGLRCSFVIVQGANERMRVTGNLIG
ncbi:MAG: hypothetical protein ACRDEA_22905, partial [Microcystaceae cyanobacterium]